MPKFQNASIGGKISIAWDELIVNPFSKWWDSKGRPAIVKKITGIGKDIAKAGGNWFKESLKDLLPGGDKAGIADYLAGFLGLSGGLKLFKGGKSLYDLITGGSGGGGKTNPLGDSIGTINVSAAVVNVNGGIGNGNSTIPGTNPTGNKEIWLPESVKRKMQQTEPKTPAGPTRTPGGLFGLGGSGVTLKNGETVAATGWKAWLGNLGVKLGSGAATAGGKLGAMGSMSLAAGGNLQSAGVSALSLASALASAASTIASAASTTAAQANAISSITSGSYLNNGGSKSGKKTTGKKTTTKPKVQTALPKNGKFFHNAKGSLVRGHIVSELGEEGNEMVIPLSRHRSRALSLWNQAGQILGVTKHAKGGLVGGSSRSGKASSGSSQPVINVGGITISVNASGNDGIVDAIKNSKGEIADAIMQAIADAIGSTASNRTAEVM